MQVIRPELGLEETSAMPIRHRLKGKKGMCFSTLPARKSGRFTFGRVGLQRKAPSHSQRLGQIGGVIRDRKDREKREKKLVE